MSYTVQNNSADKQYTHVHIADDRCVYATALYVDGFGNDDRINRAYAINFHAIDLDSLQSALHDVLVRGAVIANCNTHSISALDSDTRQILHFTPHGAQSPSTAWMLFPRKSSAVILQALTVVLMRDLSEDNDEEDFAPFHD